MVFLGGKSFLKLWPGVDTGVREQVKSKTMPSSLCLGTACLVAMQREGLREGTLGQGKQVASYQDCPEDGSYTFAFVRNSDKKGACSQGPRHFRGNLPSYADFPFIDNSSLIIVPLGWPLGSAVLLMEGKTAFSSLFLSCCIYTWAWNRAESTSPQKPWAMEWKSQLPHGLNIHVKKQNHWEDLDLS